MDVIFYLKRQFAENKINGHISFDLSKAFGSINRNKLWWALYEKGIPMSLIKNIVKGHDNNILQGKHEGTLGKRYKTTKESSKEAR